MDPRDRIKVTISEKLEGALMATSIHLPKMSGTCRTHEKHGSKSYNFYWVGNS